MIKIHRRDGNYLPAGCCKYDPTLIKGGGGGHFKEY